ncbi:adenosylcobinamide-phosphate synthase CbiB [Pelobacter propionicus]|uniref:Cobalamin biosynthesis protein CobD n=1 Tax=Pelobacter propionicus (strain DSM 2379 / NBRC 103807 / OttBd1) TaxID=338966 RepID=COBD_PELPD|nr:adenosylcobinamide-phosphate synthase CbiB [Pelobacter propionicus]A1AMC9.1 RecName: Full=Cobalamin biosynthesis protein CobD [Pelobacter propionicus DSM 2379]ABK98499.1 adenosylcobinamide-phosphate synthase [Pelobacter propionicus DSM 2379]
MIQPDPTVLALALLLDLCLGDPRWLPHPVVMIGRLITFLETLLRRCMANERIAGVLLLALTVTSAASVTWLMVWGSARLHALAGLMVAALLSSTCLAARSLQRESCLVADALDAGDIASARVKLSYIVGRDTVDLDEEEIWRALIETVAENTTDGIIAPLFWLALGGPVAGMAFKAVSTLDSMVGYKNERYLRLGWASARMDDLVNYIPARLTALLMVMVAPLIGLSQANAASIALRDRLNHPSPNSAHPESAAAGALGIRLGGPSTYGGLLSVKQFIGDPLRSIDGQAYRGMIRLMYATTLAMAVISLATAALLRGIHVTQL